MQIELYYPDAIADRTPDELRLLQREHIEHLAAKFPNEQPYLVIKRGNKPESRASFRSLLSLYRLGLNYEVVGVLNVSIRALRKAQPQAQEQAQPIEKLLPEKDIFVQTGIAIVEVGGNEPVVIDSWIDEEQPEEQSTEQPAPRRRGRPRKNQETEAINQPQTQNDARPEQSPTDRPE